MASRLSKATRKIIAEEFANMEKVLTEIQRIVMQFNAKNLFGIKAEFSYEKGKQGTISAYVICRDESQKHMDGITIVRIREGEILHGDEVLVPLRLSLFYDKSRDGDGNELCVIWLPMSAEQLYEFQRLAVAIADQFNFKIEYAYAPTLPEYYIRPKNI